MVAHVINTCILHVSQGNLDGLIDDIIERVKDAAALFGGAFEAPRTEFLMTSDFLTMSQGAQLFI